MARCGKSRLKLCSSILHVNLISANIKSSHRVLQDFFADACTFDKAVIFYWKKMTSDKDVRLKKEIGLLEGVSIIVGIIIGSGIFISPKGVLEEAHSVGLTLLVWILTGLLSMIGAVCYAELGTTILRSGGDYAYIHESLGPLPAFLFLWDANVVFVPTSNAIMGLTFAKYVVQPFFPTSCLPDYSVRLIAAAAILFLTFLNCYDVRITTRVQNVFLVAKIAGLLTVIIAGCVYLLQGNTGNFENPWVGTQTEPGSVAVCFYSGIFSYAGWNYLNFMTEELKDPYRNLPRAIYISLPLVTSIYVLANVGYLAVMTRPEMLASDAIAVTFGNKILGAFSFVMPIFVALSTFGGLSVHIMTSSRLLFTGSRNGQFPRFLSLISTSRSTPTPALVFLAILRMIWLRYKKPHLHRPIKYPLAQYNSVQSKPKRWNLFEVRSLL
ncbi:unnamed protein product [Allacma fusca]|uniref:Y+L amino acid transporter 2 n=1 Tax=Allacma fusca TaxID=39272 RepID=A0A8J2L065_9HEXA|nr:unnamed protein product [Allacma fusca]